MKDKKPERVIYADLNFPERSGKTMLAHNLLRHLISDNQIKVDVEISPDNIIYIEDANPVVIDFGAVKLRDLKADQELHESIRAELEQKRLEIKEALLSGRIVPMPVPDDTAEQEPPAKAQSILCFLLRANDRDVVIGDLAERYGREVERRGKVRADFWYYKQVAWSVPSFLRLLVDKAVWLRRLGR